MADVLAARGTRTYVYRVFEPGFTAHGGDNPLWNGLPKWRQAVSASDVPPETVALSEPRAASGDAAVGGMTGRATMAYLAHFARTGDPNGPSQDGAPLPRWELHTPGAASFMALGPGDALGMRVASDQAAERTRFALIAEYLENLPERGEDHVSST